MGHEDAGVSAPKADLRRKLRFRRDQYASTLSDFVTAIAFRAPPAPLRALLINATCVGGYLPVRNEAPVDGLLSIAAEHGVVTALPWFSDRAAAMQFVRWNAGDAVANGPWQVLQPTGPSDIIEPDLLLCPLLGFDRAGGRIGQGGGHYDRFMASSSKALRIGIAWSVQEVDAVPREPHDLPLDAILTEQEWIVTGERL